MDGVGGDLPNCLQKNFEIFNMQITNRFYHASKYGKLINFNAAFPWSIKRAREGASNHMIHVLLFLPCRFHCATKEMRNKIALEPVDWAALSLSRSFLPE